MKKLKKLIAHHSLRLFVWAAWDESSPSVRTWRQEFWLAWRDDQSRGYTRMVHEALKEHLAVFLHQQHSGFSASLVTSYLTKLLYIVH